MVRRITFPVSLNPISGTTGSWKKPNSLTRASHHRQVMCSAQSVPCAVARPPNGDRSNSKGVINQNKGYPGYENNVPPLTSVQDN
jgi:hypothetical protein